MIQKSVGFRVNTTQTHTVPSYHSLSLTNDIHDTQFSHSTPYSKTSYNAIHPPH